MSWLTGTIPQDIQDKIDEINTNLNSFGEKIDSFGEKIDSFGEKMNCIISILETISKNLKNSKLYSNV